MQRRIRNAVQPLRECCGASTESSRVWRSGTDAGRPGPNGCRVGESILVTGMFQNLSRGSDTLGRVCMTALRRQNCHSRTGSPVLLIRLEWGAPF